MRTFPPIVLALVLFIPGAIFGQERTRQERAVMAFDAGVQHILDGNLKRATKSLRKSVGQDSTFLPGRRMLGLAYDLQDDYPAALNEYLGVLQHDPYFSRLLYFNTGETYLRNGQPREALAYFTKFSALQAEDIGNYGLVGEQEQSVEAQIVRRELAQRILAAQISADSSNYVNATGLYNLGGPVNTGQNDYFPFLSNDRDYLLYTRQGENGDEDLIEGHRRRPERNYRISRFGSFNTSQPEGMCTLERDGETIFFTMCHDDPGAAGGCDIYRGVLLDGHIEEVRKLPAYVNSSTWDSQAAISCDGQQLFFASTRPGGVGGSDLYFCSRLDDGSWSEPRNLGTAINTPQDEEAPFLSNDAETLYFSSMGHGGLGDQDIYFSRLDRTTGRWAAAVNIGPPINSPARELGFHLTADGRQGYFASDRPGGQGGLDIYGFTLNEKLTGKDVTYVSGYLTDSLTGEPIVDQAVPVTGGGVYRTNYAGRFFICAPPDRALPLTVDHAAYLPYRRSFDIPRWDNASPYRIDLRLRQDLAPAPPPEPAPPTPPTAPTSRKVDVFFAVESAEVTAEQGDLLELMIARVGGVDRIEAVLLRGYTDETGTADFNLSLSRQRAETVAAYLMRRGVAEDRITVEARGIMKRNLSRKLKRRVEVVIRLR